MYTENFEKAFLHSMKEEVGSFFDPTKSATILGLINTASNRKACGYVNHPNDKGGVTKYGIAQAANPEVNVESLTLEGAKKIYFSKYWVQSKCDKITNLISVIHFDTAINMGVNAAAKMLQNAIGVKADGVIGPVTLSAINSHKNPLVVCQKYLELRQARYDTIVKNNPSQKVFANGWRNRNLRMYKTLGIVIPK